MWVFPQSRNYTTKLQVLWFFVCENLFVGYFIDTLYFVDSINTTMNVGFRICGYARTQQSTQMAIKPDWIIYPMITSYNLKVVAS